MSKVFLKKLVDYFDKHPEELKQKQGEEAFEE